MLLTNRLFEREPPSREAKSIYIFCEGAKREYQYFLYFREMDSRVNIEVYHLHPHQNNSPLGLLNIAKNCIIPAEDNPNPKYRFQQNDEVWIILDVDEDRTNSRKLQVEEVIRFCNQNTDWEVLQSNPCFEVWLYYHLFSERKEFVGDDKCKAWKKFVNASFTGGFDSRRHPVYIQRAVTNSKLNFRKTKGKPEKGCTEVYKLGESMVELLKEKLEKALSLIENE